MGCDIHFYVERFSDEPITNGPIDISEQRDQKISSILEENKIEPRWISADKWVLGDDKRWEYIDRFYSGRNYHLFSILAGVRTWEEDVAICKPKGIPEDSSYAYKYECVLWNGDAHSHSYFTLEELLDVDWESKDLKWFEETIEKMKNIDHDPKKVRCCFFFDN